MISLVQTILLLDTPVLLVSVPPPPPQNAHSASLLQSIYSNSNIGSYLILICDARHKGFNLCPDPPLPSRAEGGSCAKPRHSWHTADTPTRRAQSPHQFMGVSLAEDAITIQEVCSHYRQAQVSWWCKCWHYYHMQTKEKSQSARTCDIAGIVFWHHQESCTTHSHQHLVKEIEWESLTNVW